MNPYRRANGVDDPHFANAIRRINADLAALVVIEAQIRDFNGKQDGGAVERLKVEIATKDTKVGLDERARVKTQRGFRRDGKMGWRNTLQKSIQLNFQTIFLRER